MPSGHSTSINSFLRTGLIFRDLSGEEENVKTEAIPQFRNRSRHRIRDLHLVPETML
jgi:hypothetical protein